MLSTYKYNFLLCIYMYTCVIHCYTVNHTYNDHFKML